MKNNVNTILLIIIIILISICLFKIQNNKTSNINPRYNPTIYTSPNTGGAIGSDDVAINKILSIISKDKSTQIRACGNNTIENRFVIPEFYMEGSRYVFEGMDGGFDIYSKNGTKNESCVVFGVGKNSERCKDVMSNFNKCKIVWDGNYDL
ncbi:MAG: hypothetical protein NTX85_03535 [Candidatus Nomurabacteria bacterium]|nr:hypothetical protein [Candidatus Nomurabacteria bacterium]